MQSGLRQRLSNAVNGRFPRLSWDIWGLRRSVTQARPADIAPAVRNHWERSRTPRFPRAQDPAQLLLVVPSDDHVRIPWQPGEGNYSFELYQTACAYLGADRVRTIRIAEGGTADSYHEQILDALTDHDITHVLSRIDIEANAEPHWNWDRFARKLRARWPGVFLPLSYDSAYPYVSMHLDRITRLNSRAVPIVLDRPITGVIRPVRPAAGPLFLPLSDASTNHIMSRIGNVEPDLDLTFIGNVDGYPYRVDLLRALAAEGLEVTVNPHGRSPESMAGFTAYAEALRRSRITLNFTRCNGVPVTQLKTRMLEGSLFGSVVAADSGLYARDYFVEGEEFISYDSPRHLRVQVTALLAHPTQLAAIRERAHERADILRVRNFWEATDRALAARGFPTLASPAQ